jgi:hypothetical protein
MLYIYHLCSLCLAKSLKTHEDCLNSSLIRIVTLKGINRKVSTDDTLLCDSFWFRLCMCIIMCPGFCNGGKGSFLWKGLMGFDKMVFFRHLNSIWCIGLDCSCVSKCVLVLLWKDGFFLMNGLMGFVEILSGCWEGVKRTELRCFFFFIKAANFRKWIVSIW